MDSFRVTLLKIGLRTALTSVGVWFMARGVTAGQWDEFILALAVWGSTEGWKLLTALNARIHLVTATAEARPQSLLELGKQVKNGWAAPALTPTEVIPTVFFKGV